MVNKITILLTTTVYVHNHKCYLHQTKWEDRRNTYLKSIQQWLQKTNFNIVAVENSGYKFKELDELLKKYKSRFEFIGFSESELQEATFLNNNNSKGASEVFSINYAFQRSTLLQSAEFIIKVTGRYFISELQEYLANFNISTYDGLTQDDNNKCEIVGCHAKHFKNVFDNNLLDEHGNYTGHVEFVYRYRLSKYPNVIKCKIFTIQPTQRGGTPEIYSYL